MDVTPIGRKITFIHGGSGNNRLSWCVITHFWGSCQSVGTTPGAKPPQIQYGTLIVIYCWL